MDIEDIDKTPEEQEKKVPKYISRQGFEIIPLLRGFTEISMLWTDITTLGAFICGGYARYCASPSSNPVPASDVDIYCPSEIVFDRVMTHFFAFKLEIKHENNMALTYKKPAEGKFRYTPTIQLIKPVNKGRIVAMGGEKEVLANFDFTIVRAAIINQDDVLVDADFLHDEEKKILRLKNIHCPISSTLRCMKYAAKGYWLPPSQALSLFLDWDKRDENYRIELAEYLEKANGGEGLTQEQIDHLEELMRID